jgi:glyoxylase I family protein
MRIRRLDHVAVRIADLARSRAFYEGLLGLPAAERPQFGFPGAWYDAGGTQVHLLQNPQTNPTVSDDIDPTAPHFAFEVTDLAGVRHELDARGIPYLAFGDEQLWVRDPDGYVVELREVGAP